ncbi:MAG: glycolate oxidase iron-sulfur subunit [Caulobacteraceae bacterium]|nr:glycolate oxidase iron-sulfur subunit [Caulobacteraceae bacterium]
MTTCPSGVNYAHLVDHARDHIERTYRRPLADRLLRALLAAVLTRTWLFRLAARAAAVFAWAAPLAPGRLKGVMRMAPARLPRGDATSRPGVFPAEGTRRLRVALLGGCVQPALGPGINAAAVRLLTRHGVEVVVTEAACCGALAQHLGKAERAKALARAQIEAWTAEMEAGGLDAIVVAASGCGTSVKDYGHLFRSDPRWAARAAAVSALALDITELAETIALRPRAVGAGLTVAYHAACSLQHGQQVREAPRRLLAEAGFAVVEPGEAHLCCGSAGTYNLLQPEIASALGARKAERLAATAADVVAAGNLGCITQIAAYVDRPVVHTAQLLDWATGGPIPAGLSRRP